MVIQVQCNGKVLPDKGQNSSGQEFKVNICLWTSTMHLHERWTSLIASALSCALVHSHALMRPSALMFQVHSHVPSALSCSKCTLMFQVHSRDSRALLCISLSLLMLQVNSYSALVHLEHGLDHASVLG